MQELVRFIREHDDFVVMGHVNPDGDTVGSAIALAAALRDMGKRAFTYLPEAIPPRYVGFERPVEVVWGNMALPFAPATALCTDISDFSRIGETGAAIYNACAAHAMIDHHPTNPGFGEVQYIDGKAASTGELVTKLIGLLGVTLTRAMGSWLYIAISTDCGQFGYENTRPETMEAAADCLRAGIDVGDITRRVFRVRSEPRTRILGAIIGGLEMKRGGRIAVSRLTQKMLSDCGATQPDSDGAVNYLVDIEGVLFACLAEERGSATKFSLRSVPPLDVANNIARPLGGGGHKNAAGVMLDMPLEQALEVVLARVGKAIDALEEEGRV